MARTIKPPTPLPEDLGARGPSMFLADSIDMGHAPPWQRQVERALDDLPELTLLNPRRDDWDPSWNQSAQHPELRAQITWELDALETASQILMYLAPGSRSPVSLLELGLFARDGRMVVCCPEGFWRRANVQIVCERYGVELFKELEATLAWLRAQLA